MKKIYGFRGTNSRGAWYSVKLLDDAAVVVHASSSRGNG